MRGIHVYIDVDDVLAETTRALAGLAHAHFGRTVAFDDMTSFDLARSLGLDAREYVQLMAAAHEDAFLLDLAPIPGAPVAVSAWHAAGAEISVVTGRPPHSRAATEQWLARAGVPYHGLELVDKYGRYAAESGTPKEDLARRDYTFVIEDSLEMAEFFVAHTETTVLLMDRPWNRDQSDTHARLLRVHDWQTISATCASLTARGDVSGS